MNPGHAGDSFLFASPASQNVGPITKKNCSSYRCGISALFFFFLHGVLMSLCFGGFSLDASVYSEMNIPHCSYIWMGECVCLFVLWWPGNVSRVFPCWEMPQILTALDREKPVWKMDGWATCKWVGLFTIRRATTLGPQPHKSMYKIITAKNKHHNYVWSTWGKKKINYIIVVSGVCKQSKHHGGIWSLWKPAIKTS